MGKTLPSPIIPTTKKEIEAIKSSGIPLKSEETPQGTLFTIDLSKIRIFKLPTRKQSTIKLFKGIQPPPEDNP